MLVEKVKPHTCPCQTSCQCKSRHLANQWSEPIHWPPTGKKKRTECWMKIEQNGT